MTEITAIPWYRKPTQWIRALYEWTLSWANSAYSQVALVLLAFAEASFFPIPPDVLLMALAISRPKKSFSYAALCTLGSVAGALGGWLIGNYIWTAMGTDPSCPQFAGGAWLFAHVPGFGCEIFSKVAQLYHDNALLALFTAAFTPIPFKVFTVAAGAFHIPIWTLLAAGGTGRALRFFIVAGLIYRFGAPIRTFIEKHFEWLTLLFAALLIGGFFAVKTIAH